MDFLQPGPERKAKPAILYSNAVFIKPRDDPRQEQHRLLKTEGGGGAAANVNSFHATFLAVMLVRLCGAEVSSVAGTFSSESQTEKPDYFARS